MNIVLYIIVGLLLAMTFVAFTIVIYTCILAIKEFKESQKCRWHKVDTGITKVGGNNV